MPDLLHLQTRLFLHVLALPSGSRTRDERGQATAEYALVLLGVAAIAVAVVSWVTRSDFVGRLFGAVFDRLLGRTSAA